MRMRSGAGPGLACPDGRSGGLAGGLAVLSGLAE